MALVGLTRFKDDGRPLGLVGAVGIVLGFQAYGCTLRIDDPFLSLDGSVEEVARVYLYSRLVGVGGEADSGGRAGQLGGRFGDVAFSSQLPVVVEAVSEPKIIR